MSEINIKITNDNITKNISGIIAEALVQYQLDKLKSSILEKENEINAIENRSELQTRLFNILRGKEQRNMTKEEMDKFLLKKTSYEQQMKHLQADIMFEHIKNQKLQKETSMESRKIKFIETKEITLEEFLKSNLTPSDFKFERKKFYYNLYYRHSANEWCFSEHEHMQVIGAVYFDNDTSKIAFVVRTLNSNNVTINELIEAYKKLGWLK